jgi:hypothetical protein
MTARIGRKARRLDENVRLERPLDANPDVSPPRAGRRTRAACALGAAIACGFVIPATAHAADPFGTAQLVQEVNAAVTQATAMVPQASAASGVAPVPLDSSKTMEAATKSLEVATKQAAAIASEAAAEAQRATQSAAVASVPSAAGPAAHPPAKKAHRRAAGHRHRPAGRSSAPQSALRLRSSLLAARDGGGTRLLASPSMAPAGRPQSSGAPASRATRKPTRPSLPERSPPLPRTPQPGAAMTGQGGGQGPLTPLVVGALAAVLLIMILEFLPRTLPPKAFRKPRLIALTPWHPG